MNITVRFYNESKSSGHLYINETTEIGEINKFNTSETDYMWLFYPTYNEWMTHTDLANISNFLKNLKV